MIVRRLLTALAATTLLTVAIAQSEEDGVAMDPIDLPVTRVVLFTSGVAYFEHEGTVVGDAALELAARPDDMDDMLQTLVLSDLSGGTVRPVTYDSRDPLGRVLAGYSVDLSGQPTLAQLLAQLRGERVRLEASRTVEGEVVSVETERAGDDTDRTFVTVADGASLLRIDLAEVSAITLLDAEVEAEIAAALEALKRHRVKDEATLRVEFSGEGERRVRVGYVREVPVWKSTYRLVVTPEGATLQGWAIFDNQTDVDLEEVRISFVAGQPSAFVTELYDPVYAQRARTAPPVADSLAPRADEGVVARAAMPMAAAPAPQAAAFEAADVGAGVEAMASGQRGGASFAYHVDEPVSVGRHSSVMVPILRADVPATRVSVFDQRASADNPLAAVLVRNDTGLHLAAGTVTVYDEAGFAGNALLDDLVPGDERLLTYAVDLEVTALTEGSSEPERVVAARLVDGLLETETRQRLRYSVTLASSAERGRLVLVDVPKVPGYEVVAPEPHPAETRSAYRFGVVLGQWDPAAGSPVPVQTTCARGDDDAGPCTLEVVLERVTNRTVALLDLAPETIAFYLEDLELDGATRSALEEVLAAQREVARLQAEVAQRERRITEISTDQDRIRANMQALDRQSSLYRRYVADLEEQEDELDAVREEIGALRTELDAASDALRRLVSELGR